MPARPPPPPDWLRAEARHVYGADPDAYEAGRPDYPGRVYDVLAGRCGIGPGATVLEIGPGTGRVTRRLLTMGARVVAVEPDPLFARYLDRATAPNAVEVVVAPFEDAPLPLNRFDAVVAATSFHWVDQAVGLRKARDVLRVGGWVALWWTVFGDPARPDPFLDAATDILGPAAEPRSRAAGFELDVAGRTSDLRSAGFTDVDGELLPWTARLDPEGVRRLYASTIAVLRRPPDERARVLDALATLAADRFGGIVKRPFVTALYAGRRP